MKSVCVSLRANGPQEGCLVVEIAMLKGMHAFCDVARLCMWWESQEMFRELHD